jgi:hypothetical protein
MVNGQAIELGGGHKCVVVPHEGRVHVYGSRAGQLHADGARLTAPQARELARALIAIADELDPPAPPTVSGVSIRGTVTSRAVVDVQPPKAGG